MYIYNTWNIPRFMGKPLANWNSHPNRCKKWTDRNGLHPKFRVKDRFATKHPGWTRSPSKGGPDVGSHRSIASLILIRNWNYVGALSC